jgi:hypothetical protein
MFTPLLVPKVPDGDFLPDQSEGHEEHGGGED